ncbi:putative leucine-rich repeat receptor-like serine/threonine-protein kinase At2g19230 isoform X4 [Rhododendron vialii]|uniref:putative leucine-rich repeat receptor-like serine/threonine-protein kinase At2g19230 isoform X4 n=1 Tax=Rhododendron vialii TaxID=182163 RepID=UPI00265EB85B|nr:putative leucine-rich repeat receptor-like serine/threonine-protein kinase At2g19230 isoform X4 [Rhododendron vialii]
MKLFMLYGCLTLVLLVHGQDQSGFISIDCGIPEGSDYKDESTTISYTSDAAYTDAGTNYNISSAYYNTGTSMRLSDVRSFPQGIRNCYTLPQDKGNKCLIRALFMYGNYDSKNQPPEFALYLDGDQWDTIMFDDASDVVHVEIIHNVPTTTAYIHVCLVDTGRGTPFISALELRQLNNSIYQTQSGSLKLFSRKDFGLTEDERVRYSADVYDRIWIPDNPSSTREAFSASSSRNTDALSANDYKPPYPVMATAVRPVNGSNSLNFWFEVDYPKQQLYNVYMYFAEIGTAEQERELDIYINDAPWYLGVATDYSRPVTVNSTYSISADSRNLNFSIRATSQSTLPPILNALEIYEVLGLQSPTPTHQSEFEAIRNIKSAYKVERNWQGDPCVPMNYSWDNLQCNYDRNSTRIISLNLSSSSLTGNMDLSFSGLTSLESLDLSNNNLNGPVPDFLIELPSLKTLNLSRNNFTGSIPPALIEKSKSGSLTLRMEGNLHLFQAEKSSKCHADSCTRKKNFVVPAIASIASCLVIMAVILAIWWCLKRRKQEAHIVKSNPEYEMVEEKRRQFTYSELMTITNNFEKLLGNGASGSVYAGHLTADTKDVAVKMFSLPTTHVGRMQFQTEARLLTKVHHGNLVAIMGYCNEGEHMGLIYEYMANGTIKDRLSEKNPNILSWEKRLQIACDAARALEYLHDDCKPPIIHRDIKTSNILLNENMQAKISDFGLSRLMPSDGGTHVSTSVAGTRGYMDPKYIASSKLNKKSDVYSFGVVLLELITGKPAILRTPENILLVDWIVPMVEPMVERAEIKEIMDLRLNSDFDTNSARKALETAMACVECNLSQRLVMRQVVANLRDCLEMEKARVKVWKENEVHNSESGNTVYVSTLGSSVGGPSAR